MPHMSRLQVCPHNTDEITSSSFSHTGLVQLGHYLKQIGYTHTAVTPLTHSYNNRRAGCERANTLRDVLGWSRPFARTDISPTEFELLSNAGVLVPEGELWRSSVRWASLRNLVCAHSAYPTSEEDAVFFGPDTYRFARLIRGYLLNNPDFAERVKSAADIGCGSGAGALLVAEMCPAARVSATDINPKALQLTRVNAEVAHATQVSAVHSNLLDNLEGQFDLIISNPPYMLDEQERAYRHGGGTRGEGLSQKIVATALQRLAPGGTLLLYTGVAIGHWQDPLLASIHQQLRQQTYFWTYEELDPDVFSDELIKPAYAQVERIAAVALTLTKPA